MIAPPLPIVTSKHFRVTRTQCATWARILHDTNPIHFDVAAVEELGLGTETINPGPANLAFLYTMLNENFPALRVIRLKARLTGTVHSGDELTVNGTVRKEEGQHPHAMIHLDLRLVSTRGVSVVAEAWLMPPEEYQ